jgi:hypothetical protein
MTAFNVEVDPKRIEAHENEEAPPYEPTDVEESKPTNEDASEHESPANEIFEPQNSGEFVMGGGIEVVEEDAEEERLAEVRDAAAAAASAATKSTTSMKAPKSPKPKCNTKPQKTLAQSTKKTADEPPMAPEKENPSRFFGQEDEADRIGDERDDLMGIFPDADVPEQNIGDFFHENSFDPVFEEEPEAGGPTEELAEKTHENGASRRSAAASTKSTAPVDDHVSLVPKKAGGAKSKRPKIRPTGRKKKK